MGDIIARHAERLAVEAAGRRAQRHRGALLPFALAVAVAGVLAIAALGLGGATVADSVARGVRLRVIQGDLVPLYRDCVSPPFSVTERDAAETRGLEQIALVLEELANTPPEVTGEHIQHLRRRVQSQDLVDFAVERADRMSGEDREIMLTVQLILEEIANL